MRSKGCPEGAVLLAASPTRPIPSGVNFPDSPSEMQLSLGSRNVFMISKKI